MSRPLDLIGLALLVAAVALGLWLGLTGPDVSPIFTEAPGGNGGAGDGDGGLGR